VTSAARRFPSGEQHRHHQQRSSRLVDRRNCAIDKRRWS
jgi:hypothetical protein